MVILLLLVFFIFVLFLRTTSRSNKAPKKRRKKRTYSSYAKVLGEIGEESVASILRTLPKDYVVFNDVYLEIKGKSTQIDHVVISRYGVFIIETKIIRVGFLGMILRNIGLKLYMKTNIN